MAIHTRPFLIVEFLLLFVGVPTIVIVGELAASMMLFLWGGLVLTYALYRVTQGPRGCHIWRWEEVTWVNMRPVLLRFVLSAVLLIPFLAWYDPDRLFMLPMEKPGLWLFVMLAYPLLSALPQEFIFCSYFFHRYRPLFGNETRLIWASALVFAYAHMLFINWVAPVFGFIAGYFFASTYAKHRSLALVTIEHALYGNWIFTLGLGWYFYHGAVQ